MPSVVLYSKPGCVQCNAVKRWLNSHDVDYTIVDVSTDEDARQALVAAGFQGVPVTEIGDEDAFYGFDVEKLNALVDERP